MHHNHHQRFYQYAGPPSIVMGTWGDRVSRSHFAPPPAPFAMPPAGVPGGRLGPAPNSRMNTGYHSLQYTPVPNEMKERHHVLEKKGSSAKYSRDGSDQLHKLPQVIWSVSVIMNVHPNLIGERWGIPKIAECMNNHISGPYLKCAYSTKIFFSVKRWVEYFCKGFFRSMAFMIECNFGKELFKGLHTSQ